MGTINDLCVSSSAAPSDKLVIWKDSDGVTRSIPVSTLAAAQSFSDLYASVASVSLLGNFTQLGLGATTRTITSKLQDVVSPRDFDVSSSSTTSIAAAGNAMYSLYGGGTVEVPAGNWSSNPRASYTPGVVYRYTGPNIPVSFAGEAAGSSYIAQAAQFTLDAGAHVGKGHSAQHFEHVVVGSGNIGPTNADIGLSVSARKQNPDTTSVAGEIDGGYFFVRNGGTNSDTSGFLIDVANYGTGTNFAYESVTTSISGATVTKQIGCQSGVVDTRSGFSYGHVLRSVVGTNDVGLQFQTDGGTWTNLIRSYSSGVQNFLVTGAGHIGLYQSGTTTNEVWLRNSGGKFSVTNSGEATEVMSLTQAGVLTVLSNIVTGATVQGGTLTSTGGLTVSGAATIGGNIGGNSISATSNLSAGGTLTVTGASTLSGGIVGTTSVGNASAGNLGELISNSATAVSLTSGAAANVTSITLTAGDWDVSSTVLFVPAGTTVMQLQAGGPSTTSATLGALGSYGSIAGNQTAGQGSAIASPTIRVNVSASTTVFCVALSSFTTSTCTASGLIRARRIR
jgi:hypothetical protein